jgi:hypothetical protein
VPNLLWPPNHALVPIRIAGVMDPDQQDIVVTVTAVTQDEPVLGTGSGDTSPDAVITRDGVLVRAERAGNGNGRVYVVHFTADDNEGGRCDGTVRVTVPTSMGANATAVDDGQGYDSTQP